MDAERAVRPVTPEYWRLLKDLFNQALSVEPAARSAFLRAACAGDTSLERSVAALVEHHEASAPDVREREALLTPEAMAEIILADRHGFVPGEVVGQRFRIEQFIAEGGMGEVYVAEDLELGERVALKTIRPELANDERILARFKREIQLARKVTHRHVSRVFDLFFHHVDLLGERRTVVFLSMELLQGETLSARIRRTGALPFVEARSIAAQLVAGLDAAHRAGIIHRDFKSANVVLVSDPDKSGGAERAVIMDFGLASTLRPSAQADPSGGLAGTPAYMAPEQVEDGPLTAATDIYALGVVLFEMTTGTLPFRGATPMETARLRLVQDAPPLRSVVPAAPAAWDRTVRACLQRDPAKRPASARDVEARLAGRDVRRRQGLTLAAALVVIALGGGAWYWTTLPYRPTPEAQAAADSARVKLTNHTESGYREALADYRRAIELDPGWSLPWAELAHAYAKGANVQQIASAVARREGRSAALQAIRLDNRSAKAFGVLGWVQSLDFDEWPQAEANLRRALSLDPGDGQVHHWLGVHLRKKGRFADSESAGRRALDLTGRVDASFWCELAFLYWTSGQLDRMEAFMQELLVAHPNHNLTRFINARLLKERGRYDEALAELDFSRQLQYSVVTVMVERASIYAYRGDSAAARALLEKLTEIATTNQPVDTLLTAGVYARLGDFDAAFEWLEKGYASRDSTLLSIATSPVLKPLHNDPRFAELCRRLHYDMSQLGSRQPGNQPGSAHNMFGIGLRSASAVGSFSHPIATGTS
jgi:tetratricopeptide (TPR) repeat protein